MKNIIHRDKKMFVYVCLLKMSKTKIRVCVCLLKIVSKKKMISLMIVKACSLVITVPKFTSKKSKQGPQRGEGRSCML